MNMQSLSNLCNWFYFENDTHGTYRECKRNIFRFLEENKIKYTSEDWDKVFCGLLYEGNCYSINQRYGDKDFNVFVYNKTKTISRIQALKSVQCWLYQSCEGDGDTTKLYKLIQKIEKILLNAIICDLEEYQQAEWN